MTRDANVYLLQIQEAVNRIRRYTEGGREGFLADSLREVFDQLLALTGPHTSPGE